MEKEGAPGRAKIDEACMAFNEVTYKVVKEFQALNDPYMTAVVQPQFEDLDIVKYGEGFLSNLDCFHPSLYANQAFALGLWDNMFVPSAQKAHNMILNDVHLFCPTASNVFAL